METDPFDEFNMKPITGGLGFHKKTTRLGVAMRKVTKDSMGADLPQSPPPSLLDEDKKTPPKTLDKLLTSLNQIEQKGMNFSENSSLQSPIQQKTSKRASTAIQQSSQTIPLSSPTISPPLMTPTLSSQTETRAHPHYQTDTHSPPLTPIALSIPSLLVDIIVATTVSLIFILCFLMINDVNSLQVLSHVQTDLKTQISLYLMYLTIFIIYTIFSRGYFGRTLGEWTFECQLGQNHQIQQTYYPLLVFWRSVLVASSFFILPILSLIMKKDITYYLTGLQLYRTS